MTKPHDPESPEVDADRSPRLSAGRATPYSLLQRLRADSSEADWRQLYRLYAPLIRRWLTGYGISDVDADDFIQEVFHTLVKEIPAFQHNGNTGAFRNWLRTTLVFRLQAHWRDQRTKKCVPGQRAQAVLSELEDPASEPNLRWDREHDQFVVRQLLQIIEPEFRASTWQAFRRQVLDGQSAKQTALELGLTANAVLISKPRVLRRLREEASGLIDEHASDPTGPA